MWTVDLDAMQPFADTLPAVGRYCTDGAAVYGEVIWPDDAWHTVSIAKEETYTIEGINADLRMYLGRLKRRSRCFNRSAAKLAEAGGSSSGTTIGDNGRSTPTHICAMSSRYSFSHSPRLWDYLEPVAAMMDDLGVSAPEER